MDSSTYDPVLAQERLAWLRLLNPLRSPEPGRALVLVPNDGPALTVRPGEEISDAWVGRYQTAYTVDTTEHRLVLEIPLLSRDPTFAFRSEVALVCAVVDPAEVVARGIRDMSDALFDHMRRMLRAVSRDYDIAEFHEAEAALNRRVRDFTGDTAVRLRNIHVELLVDEDEVAISGRTYRDVVRETRLAGMRRQRHLDMLRADGFEGLIAEIMEREGPRAAQELIAKAEAEEREELMRTFKLVLERGDADREPFEVANTERMVLGRLLGGSEAPFGGTRASRVRGGMADRAVEDRSRGWAEDRPATVLPGEVVPPSITGPPDDEPLADKVPLDKAPTGADGGYGVRRPGPGPGPDRRTGARAGEAEQPRASRVRGVQRVRPADGGGR
ncbi:hypothetical protein [Kitasatospora cathayae]|uniref:Band 7 domain-containing protein n=1 Tax=Kitasatospora cathayae TaxID=3004092 RepID=A0ABY7Q9E3_9ACTN|nr:hypothetical protein [Kitasatospora sp. HUAS 3-15]WBP89272.1 hypothetical protein O1G21_27800 [Kitasatospora sp. HUAS 3-15]